jgi:hypothetical protein
VTFAKGESEVAILHLNINTIPACMSAVKIFASAALIVIV